MAISTAAINSIGEILNNNEYPLKKRFRALFTLKNIGGIDSIKWICRSFSDTSELLKHECAYCLGQMQDLEAVHFLMAILENKLMETIVRHEAAEALAAIGSLNVLPLLQYCEGDPDQVVSETCKIGVSRLKWLHSPKANHNSSKSVYGSVDPAPPSNETDILKLKAALLNEDLSLFERYQAMFALRNIGNENAVVALTEGLKHGSALFRHEIAFVLGQLQHEASVLQLIESLENLQESPMVRHECAEALGAIATEQCKKILETYLRDNERIVRESCEVALDMCEYENSFTFQYADCLKVTP